MVTPQSPSTPETAAENAGVEPAVVRPELGFYVLAGQARETRDALAELVDGERDGYGTVFISERLFARKEAAVLCGAVGATTERLRIQTATTNHNIRHPMVTAGMAATMQSLTGGRFVLGIGRGVELLQDAYGFGRITTAQMEDFAGIMRRLFRGEVIFSHDGPCGSYPLLFLDTELDEHLPMGMVAFGPNTLALAGRCFDEVVLHTYFTDETTQRCVDAVRRSAQEAGRDPAAVKIWACLAVVGDHLSEQKRLLKTVGRLGTYLQGYGALLVRTNGWDPAVLERFLADPVVGSVRGLDMVGTTEQLAHAESLLPDEWLANAATGTPEQCVAAIRHQFDLGVDGVIMHGSSPADLAPVMAEYQRTVPVPAP